MNLDVDETMDDFVPAESLVVNDLETLKITVDPLRLRLIDLLRRQPATAKALAAALETEPRSLYYHLSLLERHGLIRVVETRLVSGIQEKTYRASAYLFVFQDFTPLAEGGLPPLDAVVSSIFHITEEELRAAIARGRIDLRDEAPPERALHNDWRLLRLTGEEAASLAARLDALLDEYPDMLDAPATGEEADGDRRTYRLLTTMFPTHQLPPPERREPRP
jgi:DNA-binding transcriptional ArsR family regulator